MIQPRYRWRSPVPAIPDPACVEAAAGARASPRLAALLMRRGIATPGEMAAFFAQPAAALHDPRLLPDADAALWRVAAAQRDGGPVLVYGDFDADGISGLAILVLALRRLGIDARPYVPERLDEGHGLSLRAVDLAARDGIRLIVTADCGTSSAPEIETAAARGIDVLVTDHHHAPVWPAAAIAVVNPQRADSVYPDRRLTGAGVAWKLAALLLDELAPRAASARAGEPSASGAASASDLADLAIIGTVADVAPILGENRAIAKLGLARLRTAPRPGIAALLARAGVSAHAVDLDTIGFAIAPRLNAAGRVGEAARAAHLLLAEDADDAVRLADEIDAANTTRRSLTASVLQEAEAAVDAASARAAAVEAAGAEAVTAAILVRGDWPVGIVGLVAGRLVEEHGRPAIVATPVDPSGAVLRASCRSPRGFNLAEALVKCEDLLVRHGGHAAAAGFEIGIDSWPAFERRFQALAAAAELPSGPPELWLDLVLPAAAVDYALVADLAKLEPTGPGNPRPLLGISGLTVQRVRAASGGHTQLVLRRERDVLDAVAFRRPDLAALTEGERIDVAARPACRTFGGFESIQLEVRDVAPAGAQLSPVGFEGPVGTATAPGGIR